MPILLKTDAVRVLAAGAATPKEHGFFMTTVRCIASRSMKRKPQRLGVASHGALDTALAAKRSASWALVCTPHGSTGDA